MFEAQYLFSGDEVYSPWMSRSADNLIFTVDLIANSGTDNLTIEVFQKNSEQTGDGFGYPAVDSTGGTPDNLEVSTPNIYSSDSLKFTGVLELVRFKITAGGTGKRFLFRMLSNIWYDDVNAATGA